MFVASNLTLGKKMMVFCQPCNCDRIDPHNKGAKTRGTAEKNIPAHSAVTTVWRYRNSIIIFIFIIPNHVSNNPEMRNVGRSRNRKTLHFLYFFLYVPDCFCTIDNGNACQPLGAAAERKRETKWVRFVILAEAN